MLSKTMVIEIKIPILSIILSWHFHSSFLILFHLFPYFCSHLISNEFWLVEFFKLKIEIFGSYKEA